MGESEAPPIAYEGIFSLVAPLRNNILDLNWAYLSSLAMQCGPMQFKGVSPRDDGVTRHLFVHANGDNVSTHDVFKEMSGAQYSDTKVHISSHFPCQFIFFVWPSANRSLCIRNRALTS
jgi:hypothetical protein